MREGKSMIGLDTGYFVRLLEGHREAKDVWHAIIDGEASAASCLSVIELARMARKGVIAAEAEVAIREAILGLCRVCWLDREEVLLSGANMAHGLRLPAVDALILAGLISAGANRIYTTDSRMEAYKKKGVRIIRM
jgi:predicted nucleic acid-binding protein